MKIRFKDGEYTRYVREFVETPGEIMWTRSLKEMSDAGTLEVTETTTDGTWVTNATFLHYPIGIPVKEQDFFEVVK